VSNALLRPAARPLSIVGSMIRVALPHVAIGEICELRASATSPKVLGKGMVVAVDSEGANITILGPSEGFSRDLVVVPTRKALMIDVSEHTLGTVLDAAGACVERLAGRPASTSLATPSRAVLAAPAVYHERRPIDEPFPTGVRAIDGLLTCGVGQRMGIFASAGCGKTTLINMILDHASADVYVVALVGERGREVAEFVARTRGSERAAQTVVVYATSDTAPANRCNAALVATTVAEYFRDRGQRVVLMVDSITRYARALRDLALSAGEPPARRGYPASVFENLPRLLERPGRTGHGSITAFYAVLLEDEEDNDAVGEEVKSLLDGHIYLSSKLAGQGHFPAIDMLRSTSRLFNDIVGDPQKEKARRVRGVLSTLADMQVMLDLGEYTPGANKQYDDAIARKPSIHAFLCQKPEEYAPLARSVEALHALAR
jgi:type III secretion system ATPase